MSSKRSRANYESDRRTDNQPPFVFFGTPLPPLDSETRDDGTYVPLWKQEVRDERGRKRLHGAFTGGFSAGYFNTVGSKDGWTPSTFVSSRSERRKEGDSTTQQQKAEDFMDDEDLADAEEARLLETQASFAGLGSTQDDGSRRGFMTDLFKTTEDTMGIKLLQRMGWRQGQGVGPKVRRAARDVDERGTKGKGDEQVHLFAPEDSPMISLNRKMDRFGLGYEGEGGLAGRSTAHSSGFVTQQEDDEGEGDGALAVAQPVRSKTKAKRSGLGVGILNDTRSDDEDPYEMGPKISYSRVIGGDKRKKRGGIITKSTSRPISQSRKIVQKSVVSGFRRCHDGKLPLDGFILASAPLEQDQENDHPPPTVPEGWQPKVSQGASKDDTKSFQSTSEAAKASDLDPSRRAALLGEQALPGKSIFDFLSSSTRNKLAQASGRADLPQAKNEAAPAGYEQSASDRQKSLWDLVPRLDSGTAQAALARGRSGWMPYAEDANKRDRYRAYLETMAGTRHELPARAKGSATDEWISEMREFAQAAQVFKPVSGLMATRFTSSSSAPRLASDAHENQSDGTSGSDATGKPQEKLGDPAEQAARMGMFGPMTRKRETFYPTRLLCKRFNVKTPAHVLVDPGQGGRETRPAATSEVLGKAMMEQMMREASWTTGSVGEQHSAPAAAAAETTTITQSGGLVAELARSAPNPEAVDVEKNEAIEADRAGEAVFKAIFGSDDEDD